MANKTLRTNVNQAVQDFDNIKQAIIDKGVEVPNGTPTSEYATKIGDIQGGNEELSALIDGSLDKIQIPNGVTEIRKNAFGYCQNAETVNISSSVTKINENAFQYCNKLKSLNIPSNVNTVCKYAFYYCTSLETLNIQDGVNVLEPCAFNNCSKLKKITMPKTVTSIGDSSNSVFTSNICETAGYIGSGCDYEFGWDNSFPSNAFSSFNKLKSVIIPETIKTMGQRTFYYCTSLTSIVIPASVTSIGQLSFCSCSNLEYIKFEGLFNYTNTGYYQNSTKLKTFELNNVSIFDSMPGWVENVIINGTVYVGNYTLSKYTALTVDSILNIFNALEENTTGKTYKITLGATNLEKLTEEQKQIAIDKNYTLA